MTDPRTFREQNIRDRGLEARLVIFQRMIWTLITFVGGLVLGAIALNVQIGDLKSDAAAIKTNGVNVVDRLNVLDKRLTDIDARLQSIAANVQEARADDRVVRGITRIESQLPKPDPIVGGFYVTANEAAYVAQFLRPPVRNNNQPTITVGSQIDPGRLRPLPDDVISKVPRLSGMRYVVDDNNAIALVPPVSNVVFAII